MNSNSYPFLNQAEAKAYVTAVSERKERLFLQLALNSAVVSLRKEYPPSENKAYDILKNVKTCHALAKQQKILLKILEGNHDTLEEIYFELGGDMGLGLL